LKQTKIRSFLHKTTRISSHQHCKSLKNFKSEKRQSKESWWQNESTFCSQYTFHPSFSFWEELNFILFRLTLESFHFSSYIYSSIILLVPLHTLFETSPYRSQYVCFKALTLHIDCYNCLFLHVQWWWSSVPQEVVWLITDSSWYRHKTQE
jgi:hypothetical protein